MPPRYLDASLVRLRHLNEADQPAGRILPALETANHGVGEIGIREGRDEHRNRHRLETKYPSPRGLHHLREIVPAGFDPGVGWVDPHRSDEHTSEPSHAS